MKRMTLVMMWLVVYALLVLLYAQLIYSWQEAFYFVSMLFPVVVGTSFFFNYHLVPRFLLRRRYKAFFLYAFYLLIVSLYLEAWVIILSLILLADYDYTALSPALDNSINMTILLYAVVFVHGFIRLFLHFQSKTSHLQKELAQAEAEAKATEPRAFTIISERKQVRLEENRVMYIESLSDYVKVHQQEGSPLISKATISSLEAMLSNDFVRIHRSYLVNKHFVESFNNEKLQIAGKEMNITRKYKSTALEALRS